MKVNQWPRGWFLVLLLSLTIHPFVSRAEPHFIPQTIPIPPLNDLALEACKEYANREKDGGFWVNGQFNAQGGGYQRRIC